MGPSVVFDLDFYFDYYFHLTCQAHTNDYRIRDVGLPGRREYGSLVYERNEKKLERKCKHCRLTPTDAGRVESISRGLYYKLF